MSTRKRAARCLAVLGLALICAFHGGPAALADTGGDPRTVPELLTLFDSADIPSDFALVVDESSSMFRTGSRPWAATRESIEQFLPALGPKDNLILVGFNDVARVDWRGPVPDQAARDEVMARLPRTYRELEESRRATNGTDIGRGLEQALDALARPDAPEFQTLVLMTDGRINAPESSAYATRESPGWARLREQAQAIQSTRDLQGIAMGLADGTDASVLEEVIPGSTTVALPPSQIGPYFSDVVTKARLRQIAPDVRADLAREVTATVVLEGDLAPMMTGTLELTSERERLDTIVDVGGVSVTGPNGPGTVSVEGPTEVTLAPGETVSIPITMSDIAAGTGPTLGRRTEVGEVAVTLDATATAAASPLLIQEQVVKPGATTTAVSPPTAVPVQRSYGVPWWLVATIAVVLLVALVAFLRWNRLPRLTGYLFERHGEEWVELTGYRMTLPGGLAWPGTGDDTVELFTRRRKPHHVFVRRVTGSPRLDFSGDPQPIGAGTPRLRLDDRVLLGSVPLTYYLER